MGVLTDLFIATEAEVQELDDQSIPIEHFPGLDMKGLDHVKLGMLHGILTGRDFELDTGVDFELVRQRSDDGPWIYRWPSSLTEGLAGLDNDSIDGVAGAWGRIDEFHVVVPPRAPTRSGSWLRRFLRRERNGELPAPASPPVLVRPRAAGRSQAAVREALQDMVDLAKQARAEGKEVFMWISL